MEKNEQYFPTPTRRPKEILIGGKTPVNYYTIDLKKKKDKVERKYQEWFISYKKTTFFFSLWNLINDICSSGNVAFGKYVAQCGLLLFAILICIFALITIYTLCILYNLSKSQNEKTLPELCAKAFGRAGHIITCIFIFCFNFGGLCSQFLMFAEVLPQLVTILSGHQAHHISRTAVLIYLTILFAPFAFMRELSSIALVLLLQAITHCPFNPPQGDSFALIRPLSALSSLGGISYTFVCHDLSFNVFDNLKKSTRAKYYGIVVISVLMSAATVTVTGICGYFLFFRLNLRQTNLVLLLPRKSVMGVIARICLLTSVSLSIPYGAFMPRQALYYAVSSIFPGSVRTTLREGVLHAFCTTVVIVMALIISLSVSDLGSVFEITGGVSACSLAYIIPPLLMLRLGEPSVLNRTLSVLVLTIGIGIFCCTCYSVGKKIFV
ncbi:hypothetical protein AKO1_012889 [Acrasis kona]|uniref:Amino acid transporter transmembrane domain-containing protein n=1 Tax=Acrasis kona TaxID=1008807 RepID=A0AAW2YWF2_9EUKA